ncbi:MAG: GcrA cell cycle regulator [Phenylobacterium sp.]|nr:GcrA cell cycle regulator [Phenylobacterium sp.]
MSWTDERVDLLKTLWAEGASCSQIAKQIGGTTRNAVIGKVHRMGLQGRDTPRQPGRIVPASVAPAKSRPARRTHAPPRLAVAGNGAVYEAAPDLSPAPLIKDPPGLATMTTLGPHMCKWPIGDPREPGFTYCGKRTGGTFCEPHAARAYTPAPAKRKNPGADLERQLRRYI